MTSWQAPSSIEDLLFDTKLRGLRQLTKHRFVSIQMWLRIPDLPIRELQFDAQAYLIATDPQGITRKVFMRGYSRYQPDPPDGWYLRTFQAQIAKAAMRIYKQWCDERRRYWNSPAGKIEKARIFKEIFDVHLPKIDAVIKDFVFRDSEIFKRFTDSEGIRSIKTSGKSKYF